MPIYTDLVNSLPATVPFVGPEAHERACGRTFAARIGANENVFGPSPLAIQAMAQAASLVWQYGDSENYDLRHALADHLQIDAEALVVGEGIDGLFGYLARLLVAPGVKVVTSLGAYPTFNFHVAGFGGEIITVPFKDDCEDPIALIEKAAEVGARMVYISNPDNPMGTVHNANVIQRMIDTVPKDCLLVLDEAYLEFAPEDTAPPLDTDNSNVIRMRTFSKAYGMAGARVAYGIGAPALIKSFDKVRNHFGVNKIAQAGALAALKDQRYLREVVALVDQARHRITQIAQDQGLTVIPSAANFVSIDCEQDASFAKRVLTHLIDNGVFVRMPFAEPQNRCIRVSAGTKSDLDLFELYLPLALEAADV